MSKLTDKFAGLQVERATQWHDDLRKHTSTAAEFLEQVENAAGQLTTFQLPLERWATDLQKIEAAAQTHEVDVASAAGFSALFQAHLATALDASLASFDSLVGLDRIGKTLGEAASSAVCLAARLEIEDSARRAHEELTRVAEGLQRAMSATVAQVESLVGGENFRAMGDVIGLAEGSRQIEAALALHGIRGFEDIERLTVPDDLRRAVASISPNTLSNILDCTQVAAELAEDLASFSSRALREAATAVPGDEDVDALVAHADQVIAKAATTEERALTRKFVLQALFTTTLASGGPVAAQKLWLVIAMLLASLPPVALPAAPSSPALFRRQADMPTVSTRWDVPGLPQVIRRAGPKAVQRTTEFFVAQIRNRNTRQAYARATFRFFEWCDAHGLELHGITPTVVAAYVEELQLEASAPTVKQHLAAIRMFFGWLVVGQVIPMNPAASVRGPKHVVKRGKTPVLSADQARSLFDSIATSDIGGLRDRALLGFMVYTFARVGATAAMRVEDYYPSGKRWWFRLHEKGGKRHEVPAHRNAEAYIDAYLDSAGIRAQGRGPLFRTLGRNGHLTERPMHRTDILRMIKRRAAAAGLPVSTCCHTFRATGITAYLENGGTIEKAQQIAAHESPRTTKLYDRTSDELTLDEIERIAI